MRELIRADARASKDTKLGIRPALRKAAEPVRAAAAGKALGEIRNMPGSPNWAQMRTGVTTKVVYVAPKQKGTHGRGRRRRPNLAGLLMDRAMAPALEENIGGVERALETMLDTMAADWAR
jgi:hypothetical protein